MSKQAYVNGCKVKILYRGDIASCVSYWDRIYWVPSNEVYYKEEGENQMDNENKTLRQRIRYAALSSDEKVLREAGFKDSTGALTEQGRRIVIDFLWDNDKDLQAALVEAVRSTLPKEQK